MKISWIFWWIANIFWFSIFTVLTLIIWIRKVDGTGAVQTPELRLLAFGILLIAFILPLIFQIIWLIVNVLITKNNQEKNIEK